MPQRFLRPGITTSDKWNSISFGAQSFYIRLLTLVDDYGRYDGRIQVLHAYCFALRPDVTTQETTAFRSECVRAALIHVYEVGGKEFVQLTQWQERARGVSRYPEPPAAFRSAPQETAAFRSGILPPSPSPSPSPSPQPSPSPAPGGSGTTSDPTRATMLGPNGQNPPGFAKATEGEKKKREGWQLAKDRARLKKQLQEARDSCRPDADLIAGLAAELRAANDELRANGKAAQ